MIVIDNFLNQKDYISLKNRLDEISLTDDLNIKEDPDHKNILKSKFYDLNYDTVKYIIEELKHKNIIDKNYNEKPPYARYHITKNPYYTKFHRDSLSYDNNKNEIDHIGITMFFNNEWYENWGGLYTYQLENISQGYKSYTQKYIKPMANTCIININDISHAVTKITSAHIERKSLQIFLDSKYFL